METSAHETLEEASKMLQTEYQRLESSLAMQKERMEFEISSRKQEEDLQRVEFETQDRVREVHKQREMEERLSRLRTEFETRVKQQELQDMLKLERWKQEDEVHARKAKIQLRRREERALLSQEKRVRQELENRLLEQQLARDRELLELENTRCARRKEQQGQEDIDNDMDAQIDRHSSARESNASPGVRAAVEETQDPRRHHGVPSHHEAPHHIKLRERDSGNRPERYVEDRSTYDVKDSPRQLNISSSDGIQDDNSEVSESPLGTPDYVPSKPASPMSVERPPSSESSMSFASASMRRTMAEMSLLEKALGNISSSVSSCSARSNHSVHGDEDHARHEINEDDVSEAGSTHSDNSRRYVTEFRLRDEVGGQELHTATIPSPLRAVEQQSPPRTPSPFLQMQNEAVFTPQTSQQPREHLEFFTPESTGEFSHDKHEVFTREVTHGYSRAQDEEVITPPVVREHPLAHDEAVSTPPAVRGHLDSEDEVLRTPQFSRQFMHSEDDESSSTQSDQGQSQDQDKVAASQRGDLEVQDDRSSTPQAVRECSEAREEDAFTPKLERHFSSHEEELFTTPRAAVEPDAHESSRSAEVATSARVQPVEDSDSDSDGYASPSAMDALQRPIAELEKKLGIRFDDFSDEEKEDEYSFDIRQDSDEEEDETIEDDRAKLLQRAKRLLELSSFDTDSDDEL
ncbi:unnamed protein product [Phytophthora fragariaefolia]|uniref:Unnamed protein product n=1 Tax=Phytophthora fragariaefolia TaxID=1490495 RepID=A0A9W7D8F7_9STRA|nr:unnamed protein product [Phytophthora fragariaefolia]